MDQKTVLKRQLFVLCGSLTIICVYLTAFPVFLFAAGVPRIIAGPYLQNVTKTSIVIMWETDKPCKSGVRFGDFSHFPDGKKEESKPLTALEHQVSSEETNTMHEFTLKNLEPQANYFYRAYSRDNEKQEVESETLTFRTAVNDATPFTYIVMGDNRTYPDRFKKLAEMALEKRPDFVLNAGDVVSDGNNKHEWIEQYLAPAAELMKRVPTYVAIGNHERNSPWFYKYVSYPSPENYYSFEYGNAHFTVVDSNADLSPGSKQIEWIEKDLASAKAKWKFVTQHHPVFGSDTTYFGMPKKGNPDFRPLISIYEKWDVDVVWCGHIHYYERTFPIRDGKINQADGVIYIQTGGGGAELVNLDSTHGWFSAKALRNWHFCLVNIEEGTFRMIAYDIDGKMYDSLELRK